MGKGLNRERRRQKQQREGLPVEFQQVARHENTSLRLVRSKDKLVPAEPIASRQPDKTISSVPEPERSHDSSGEKASGHSLDTGIDAGSDDIPIVTRSFDAIEINKVFNDETVFPLVSVPNSPAIDVAPIIADHRNFLLMCEGGGVLFAWQEAGIYEVHTAFLEAHRGRNAIRSSLAAYRWMFTHTDCAELLTRVPKINPAAEAFCKLVGATHEFDRKNIWQTKDGLADMSFWSLRYDDWVRKTPSLMKSGKAFHDRLIEERKRLGHAEPLHDDEDCHDLHVGACAEMIYGGQMDKGVALYNRWARFSGYGMISLVAHNPAIINVGDSLLQITGDTFKVIVVR